MWAPADLFSHALDIFLAPLKRMVSFFYENPMVLALALVGIASLITVLTLLGNGRASRG
ncbi:hypothetical protein [Lichenibacterium minor]|jgi:hypothetical protein|uniref:hypothetical protein n=1 Tax=Lichenibacterium minor TaxID=2316528 RepID=UPI0013ED0A40|nr:hypothetical protein [Lichenibacterium minor]